MYVCDSGAARRDARLPARLTNGAELAKILHNVLPGILEGMKLQHGWTRVPRTVGHDKVSYFGAQKTSSGGALCRRASQRGAEELAWRR